MKTPRYKIVEIKNIEYNKHTAKPEIDTNYILYQKSLRWSTKLGILLFVIGFSISMTLVGEIINPKTQEMTIANITGGFFLSGIGLLIYSYILSDTPVYEEKIDTFPTKKSTENYINYIRKYNIENTINK